MEVADIMLHSNLNRMGSSFVRGSLRDRKSTKTNVAGLDWCAPAMMKTNDDANIYLSPEAQPRGKEEDTIDSVT
jgi:hypothetical protein